MIKLVMSLIFIAWVLVANQAEARAWAWTRRKRGGERDGHER